MNRRLWIFFVAAAALVAVAAFALHHYFADDLADPRSSALELIPQDANAVLFADVAKLRAVPFFSALADWAPQPKQTDGEYAKFLGETGFDYSRDLDRIVVASMKRGPVVEFFMIGDGRFDRKKVNAYVSQFGTHDKKDGREVFTAPLKGTARKLSFVFLHQNRIALTDDPDIAALLRNPVRGTDANQWRKRFDRLGGSPAFVVFRQDSSVWAEISAHAQDPAQAQQIASLLDQLQWITFAGVPEQDRLRIVAEGECPNDATAHDLADVLNGIRLFAQAGLNGPDVRRRLDAQTREAYIGLVQSADIARVDRGETKGVRLVLEVTPEVLKATHSLPAASEPEPAHREKSSASQKKQ